MVVALALALALLVNVGRARYGWLVGWYGSIGVLGFLACCVFRLSGFVSAAKNPLNFKA